MGHLFIPQLLSLIPRFLCISASLWFAGMKAMPVFIPAQWLDWSRHTLSAKNERTAIASPDKEPSEKAWIDAISKHETQKI
jgi:hypothetical protein